MTSSIASGVGAAALTTKTDKMATGTDDGSKSAASKSKLAQNFDTFLVMLTTQLKHQDPLSPMDSTQFTNQLVQFANVEQQINANKNLETLISVQKTNQTSAAIGYLGQTIEAPTNGLPLQDGKAAFSYTLPEEAAAVSINIKNDAGKVVATMTGKTDKGRHEVTWDGKDSAGNQLADGKFTIEAVAVDREGTVLEAASTVYGKVTDIGTDNDGGTLVSMNGVVVKINDVLTIRDAASLAKAAN